jgi:hypothetical protein
MVSSGFFEGDNFVERAGHIEALFTSIACRGADVGMSHGLGDSADILARIKVVSAE